MRRRRRSGAPRAARTVMDRIFDCLVRWLAPILCFTAEEAWLARHGDAAGAQRPSRALRRGAGRRGATRRSASAGRSCASCAASSPARSNWSARAKRIGSSLQAAIELYVPAADRGAAARMSISPSSASPRRATVTVGDAARGRLHAARRAGGRRRRSATRRATNASAAGGSCRRSAPCPGTTISAGAAPMSSGRWLPNDRARHRRGACRRRARSAVEEPSLEKLSA